jgi:hypothetical protein
LRRIATRGRIKNVLPARPARTSGDVSWINASWGGRLEKLNAASFDEVAAVALVRMDIVGRGWSLRTDDFNRRRPRLHPRVVRCPMPKSNDPAKVGKTMVESTV